MATHDVKAALSDLANAVQALATLSNTRGDLNESVQHAAAVEDAVEQAAQALGRLRPLNPRCAKAAAEKYARESFLLVDFQVGNTGLSDQEAARIFETINTELAKAWLAGCEAGSNPKEAA